VQEACHRVGFFLDTLPLIVEILWQTETFLLDVGRGVRDVLATPDVLLALAMNRIELGLNAFVKKLGPFVAHFVLHVGITILDLVVEAHDDKTTTDGSGIVRPLGKLIASEKSRRFPDNADGFETLALNGNFFARDHGLHLSLIERQVMLDFHNSPGHLVLYRFQTKALLTVVGNRRDVVIGKEFLHLVENHGFASAGTSDEKRNHLPSVELVHFKEKSAEKHVDAANDFVAFLVIKMPHLIFNHFLKIGRWNILPVLFVENRFIKAVSFVELDSDDISRDFPVSLRKKELA
jgi:hypothetical protein